MTFADRFSLKASIFFLRTEDTELSSEDRLLALGGRCDPAVEGRWDPAVGGLWVGVRGVACSEGSCVDVSLTLLPDLALGGLDNKVMNKKSKKDTGC
ncbi:hypothetical protein DPMN_036189 [Dreissena polymorpha]|uniref:Uncharacterized protein n=1 Tax=Dreissena polymorpha TaxID=45954 RepID=A0A9D4MB25_DREPO|nr:hypothetical protein DPMN_036189 [Dreissena polymorpha]